VKRRSAGINMKLLATTTEPFMDTAPDAADFKLRAMP
jgi:hypothetical protein